MKEMHHNFVGDSTSKGRRTKDELIPPYYHHRIPSYGEIMENDVSIASTNQLTMDRTISYTAADFPHLKLSMFMGSGRL